MWYWVKVFAVVAFNVFTFILYCRDKEAAISKKWRTPEVVLIAASFLGGFGTFVVFA